MAQKKCMTVDDVLVKKIAEMSKTPLRFSKIPLLKKIKFISHPNDKNKTLLKYLN